jgi:hypothetical protein
VTPRLAAYSRMASRSAGWMRMDVGLVDIHTRYTRRATRLHLRYGGPVIVRYAYRIYPTADQAQMLARTFGCARRVFNAAIQVWDDAYRCNVRLTDVQVQNRVIAQAKAHPDTEWLSEVSSVAPVQSSGSPRRSGGSQVPPGTSGWRPSRLAGRGGRCC